MKAYQLKVELVDSSPLIWRCLVIPSDVLFFHLYQAIQLSMGWHGSTLRLYHTYEFDLPDENLRITNDEEAIEENKRTIEYYKSTRSRKVLDPFGAIERQLKMRVRNPRRVRLDPLVEKNKHMKYVYQFGFSWEHVVKLESVIEDYSFSYPTLLDGAGDCPPELVGDIAAYAEFLQTYHDPCHPDYLEVIEWANAQGYQPFDKDAANAGLKKQKW